MNPSRDFLSDVTLFGRRGDDELDSLLRGDTRDGQDQLVTSLTQAKRVLLEGPGPEVARAHFAAMADPARLLAQRAETEPVRVAVSGKPERPFRRNGIRRLRRIAVAVAITVLAGMGSMVGLAYAGVRLPSPALSVFHVLHVHLPNQESPSDQHRLPPPHPSHHVHSVGPTVHRRHGGCRIQQTCGRATGRKRPHGPTRSTRRHGHPKNGHRAPNGGVPPAHPHGGHGKSGRTHATRPRHGK
jgi:hypothetical protein